jgi:hypothetical protein
LIPGINVAGGEVVNATVADALGTEYVPVGEMVDLAV